MENKRVIVAVALSLIVLLGWNYFFPPAPQKPAEQAQTADKAAPAPAEAKPAAATEALQTFAPTPGATVTIATPLYTAVLNTAGGVLESFALKNYRQTMAPGSPLVDLVSAKTRAKAPLGLLIGGAPTWQKAAWSHKGGDLTLKPGQSGSLTLTGEMDGLIISREFTFSADTYLVTESLTLFSDGPQTQIRVAPTMAAERLSPADDQYNATRVAFFDAKGLSEKTDLKDLEAGIVDDKNVRWGAIESNYFLAGVIAGAEGYLAKAKVEDGIFRVALEKDGIGVGGGVRTQISQNYYLGPKETAALKVAPENLAAALNYGWFDFVAKPLIWVLHWFYGFTHNYGIAIILLTICIKLVFWPLSQKSYKSMDQMKKLQPMMAQIREKFKDDRQKMNEEMMRLYKTYKVNPAGGCLPMVVQIPVFIGLYQALLNAIELRHASFITYLPFTDMIWLADLSVKDPYYITPLAMGATMFLQQKMTPAPGDPTQAKIMLLMPVVFTFMFLNFPSGLVVYWLVNNVLSIAQQWWMLRKKA